MTSRPTHVRITGPEGVERVTVGNVYEVVGWEPVPGGMGPLIRNDDGVKWVCSRPGGAGAASLPAWEPASPPVLSTTDAALMHLCACVLVDLLKDASLHVAADGSCGVAKGAETTRYRSVDEALLALRRGAKEDA